MKKETKAERHELLRKDEARRLRTMDCHGCPYRACIGATATLSWDQMTARARGEDSPPP